MHSNSGCLLQAEFGRADAIEVLLFCSQMLVLLLLAINFLRVAQLKPFKAAKIE
jgi:hypothetical protein